MGSQIGKILSVTTFGESHGQGVGVVIEGVPAGLRLDASKIQSFLDRRRPGQSPITSPRNELDRFEYLSGIEDNVTLGSPLTIYVRNHDQKPSEYSDLNQVYRPSHADFTTLQKFGVKAKSGGGRASARETIGRVAAGAIAEQILAHYLPEARIVAWVHSVATITCNVTDIEKIERYAVESSMIRTADPNAEKDMLQVINSAMQDHDSVGGIIRCVISGIPPGLGEPVFDKLEAELAKAMLSLPATKGFEIGSGFLGTTLSGSQHNDIFINKGQKIGTLSNNSGGIQGGISNGECIDFKVAFKPVATIAKSQPSLTVDGIPVVLEPKTGRHDPCVLPRAVPMVEAMAAIIIADHYMRNMFSKI
ncbi:MAG: chorismate synthase [Proteobacteria bacterium]|nr:chorismate synthase [Pseudomonadota bacterium]